MTHQTERTDGEGVMRRDRFRPRDWDRLGWKYSLLSSIATAPFNHTMSFIPARDEEEFKALSDGGQGLLPRLAGLDRRPTPRLLRRVRPIIGPPMIGRCDGTAAIRDDRGFVFLFNPNYRRMDAASGSTPRSASTGEAAFCCGSSIPRRAGSSASRAGDSGAPATRSSCRCGPTKRWSSSSSPRPRP